VIQDCFICFAKRHENFTKDLWPEHVLIVNLPSYFLSTQLKKIKFQ